MKGEDLLFLDHPNTRLEPGERSRYSALGLEAAPFRSVGILAPPRRGDPNATPATGARQVGVRPYFWTIEDFCSLQLLPFLFADAEDERQQYTIVVQAVTARLAQFARDSSGGDGAMRIEGTTVRTFRELVNEIENRLIPEDPEETPDQRWTGRAVGGGTINAFVRRLHASVRHVEHLIRADVAHAPEHSVDLDSNQLTVVDIHQLHDRAKRFVVGVVLRQAFEAKEAVHHHGWKVVPDRRGLRTIEPSDRICHGPAHAPDDRPAHSTRHLNKAPSVAEAPPLPSPRAGSRSWPCRFLAIRAEAPPLPSPRAGPPTDVSSPVPRAPTRARPACPASRAQPNSPAGQENAPHSQFQFVAGWLSRRRRLHRERVHGH